MGSSFPPGPFVIHIDGAFWLLFWLCLLLVFDGVDDEVHAGAEHEQAKQHGGRLPSLNGPLALGTAHKGEINHYSPAAETAYRSKY